jgi:hypothetical protein
VPNYAPDNPGMAPSAGLTYHAAAAGDSFDNNGETLLIVKNTSGSPVTVTIDDPNTQGPTSAQQFNPDVQFSVPATTGERVAGPFPAWRFNNASGQVALAFSATASVTWAAARAH